MLALASADVSRDVNARGRRGRDRRHGHCGFRLGFGKEDCDQSEGKRGLIRVPEPDFTSSFVFLSRRQRKHRVCLGHWIRRQYPAV
jgi:hypothetical protein